MHSFGTFRNWSIASIMLISMAMSSLSFASDHDDGQADLKGSALNLTDLYVFREDNQTGLSADSKNLILIMNSAPRSLPEQQYYFSPKAKYEFHLTQVKVEDKNETPTGRDDVAIRFDFEAPSMDTQAFKVSIVKNGKILSSHSTVEGSKIMTTSLAKMRTGELIKNKVKLGHTEITVFAGLREDPFFFDVQQFFKVRAGAAGLGPKVGFKPANIADDFTKNYNVNAIVLRIPISLLQSHAEEPVFDVWQTISVN